MPTTVCVYSTFTLATCLCCLVCLLAHLISYGTSKWLVSDGNSPFVELGFHQACFVNCRHPYCPGGDPDRIYNRCYVWTFNPIIQNDEQYRELKDWLMPDWFNTANTVFIINIPLLFVCCITLAIATCWAFKSRHTLTSTKKRDLALLVILYITLAMLIVACLLSVTGIAIFSSNAPRRDYMPMAYRNSFGFSYWLELAVCVLLGLCCVTTFMAATAKTLHIQGPKDPRYAEDMMLGRM